MKYFLLFAFSLFLLYSCKSKSDLKDKENLPKDIALKPDNNLSQQEDKTQMNVLIKKIDSLVQTVPCKDPEQWKFAPIGAKACGGPASFIAYPKEMEAQILPEIEKFTQMQTAFNKKYQIISDCKLLLPPTGIECKDGKAVLLNDNVVSDAQ